MNEHSRYNIFINLIKLLRPGNVLIAASAVILGEVFFFGYAHFSINAIIEAVIMGLLAGAGNIENDVVDYKIDLINASHRPLASGIISLSLAKLAYLFIYAISISLAFSLSLFHGLWAAAIAVVLMMYNRYYQRLPFIGNIVVAFLCSQAVAFPILRLTDTFSRFQDFNNVSLGFIMAFAFVFTLAREMVKDIEDMEGDFQQGLKTAPIVFGSSIVRILALFLIWFGILGIVLSFKVKLLSPNFSIFASVGVILPSLVSIYYLSLKIPNWGKTQFFLKVSLLGGVISIFLSFL